MTTEKETENTQRYIMRGYDGPRDVQSQQQLALMLSESNLLGENYFKKPANIMRMMWKAMAMDIPLDTALEQVGQIKGKTVVNNSLMLALMRRGGIKVETLERNEDKTVLLVTRPGEKPEKVEYTMKDATKMGLAKDKTTSKGITIPSQYKLQPRTMLFWRAVADASRTTSSDVTNGLSLYTREEMESVPDYDDLNTPPAQDAVVDRDDAGTVIEAALKAQSASNKAAWDEAWKRAAAAGILDSPADPDSDDSLSVRDELTIIGKAIVEQLEKVDEFGFAVLATGSESFAWNEAISACDTIEKVDVLAKHAEACEMRDRYAAALKNQRDEITAESADAGATADTVGT